MTPTNKSNTIMTAYQIKNELEELIYTAISSIRESRNLLEEALTATDGQRTSEEDESDVNALTSGLHDVQSTLSDLYNQVNDLPLPDVPGMDPSDTGMDPSDTDQGDDTQTPQEPGAAAPARAITGASAKRITAHTIIGQQIGMSESFVRQLLAEKDRQIEQLTRIIQESLNK